MSEPTRSMFATEIECLRARDKWHADRIEELESARQKLIKDLRAKLADEREACAKICEGTPIQMDGKAARRGANGTGTWYEDSALGYVTSGLAIAIRNRDAIDLERTK